MKIGKDRREKMGKQGKERNEKWLKIDNKKIETELR